MTLSELATPGTVSLFATLVQRARPAFRDGLLEDLEAIAWSLADDDEAGQAWCEQNNYPGYTSYGTLNDLPTRYSVFGELAAVLDLAVQDFGAAMCWDLAGRALELDSIWVNILPEGGIHTSHIHPHSVVSGTLYLATPEGASALKVEDPRLAMMMAAPARRPDAPLALKPFVHLDAVAGDVLLWESWMRHEVVMNQSEEARISISFNYRWG